MGSRRRSAFMRSRCLVSSFSLARSFFRSASHSSRETVRGCGIVLLVIYGASFDPVHCSGGPEPRVGYLVVRRQFAAGNSCRCNIALIRSIISRRIWDSSVDLRIAGVSIAFYTATSFKVNRNAATVPETRNGFGAFRTARFDGMILRRIPVLGHDASVRVIELTK